MSKKLDDLWEQVIRDNKLLSPWSPIRDSAGVCIVYIITGVVFLLSIIWHYLHPI